ncbi:MAG: hypothetical protein HY656_00250 [Acidobacteria bacterium]|nr:hypothetical protein [Acidobacteriota bacterium]
MHSRPLPAFVLLSAALFFLGACAPKEATEQETKAAVEAGIRAHLSQRSGLALDKMEMEVKQVTVQGEKAEADVVFRSKGGEGEMAMHYTLRRQGDRWVVERSGGAGAGGGVLPPGHPPVTTPSAPPEKLPRSGQR